MFFICREIVAGLGILGVAGKIYTKRADGEENICASFLNTKIPSDSKSLKHGKKLFLSSFSWVSRVFSRCLLKRREIKEP